VYKATNKEKSNVVKLKKQFLIRNYYCTQHFSFCGNITESFFIYSNISDTAIK